jgi:PPM family protein phosphatase
MVCEFFSLSHTGRVRQNNEDSLLVDSAAGLAVLADGMGGYNAGEVASAMATRVIGTHLLPVLQHRPPNGLRQAIEGCVELANAAICEASRNEPRYRGMGTTVVMTVFTPGRVLIGHIGDSRAYRLRQGRLDILTHDHSLLQEQIDAGLVRPERAHEAPYRNLLTRALGMTPVVQLELTEHAIEPGDRFLLCSDGLNDMLRDDQIARLLAADTALEVTGHALVDAANAAGGRDNISVVLIRCAPHDTASAERAGAVAD